MPQLGLPFSPGGGVPWVSIDPGDRYVGWADWLGSGCTGTWELSPDEAVDRLIARCKTPAGYRPVGVVYERWTLYAWNQESLAGNEFLTSQLIGQIKLVCRLAGVPCVGQTAAQGKTTYKRQPWRDWSAKEWRMALHGPIGKGHTRDGYAHGAAYLWASGWRPE